MNNTEILTKAIKKAQANGWEPEDLQLKFNDFQGDVDYYARNSGRIRGLIFSHDFAKALFKGLPSMCWSCGRHHKAFMDCDAGTGNDISAWRYHLGFMAAYEEKPLEYLAKFL